MFNRRAASRSVAVATPSGDVTLNFVNADIREVVRSVIGGILKLNYAIDPNVKGTVTLQTSRPLPREAVLSTLETILRANGAALVRSANLYKVVPASAAPQVSGAPRLLRRGGRIRAGYGAWIVPLRFVSAQAMADLLKPFAAPDAILRVDSERNLLILSGTSEEKASLSDIVEIFDVDWFQGTSFALIKLDNAQPKDLITELEAIFNDATGSPLTGLVRFAPFERLNSILIVTSRPNYLDQAREWIERLDIGAGTPDERRLYVYRVENGLAKDLADVLSQIYIGGSSRSAAAVPGQVAPGRRPATISSTQRDGGRTTTGQTRTSGQSRTGGTTSQGRSQTGAAPAAGRAAGPLGAARSRGGLGTGGRRGEDTVRIIADDANNSILIFATEAEHRQIEAALKKLDVEPLQVLIEATIAEVTLNDELRYGVQWFLKSGNHAFTLSDFVGGAVLPSFPGFAHVFDGGTKSQIVLSALDGVTDLKILSSPHIMVKDNHTATIEVGDQVPIATQSATSVTDPDAPVVNSIQFRDTGVLLRVTPRVNAGGLVSLEIEQEVSSAVETETSGIDSPTIQVRKIKSTVAVHDGETIALGGLIKNETTNSKDGVPVLSDIPLLGILFGTKERIQRRTELLVLITPRVIRSREEARKVTADLRSKIGVLTRSPPAAVEGQ